MLTEGRVYAASFVGFFKREKDSFLSLGVFPELHFSLEDLENVSFGELENLRRFFDANSILPSIHAPYIDMYLGARDAFVVDAVRKRYVFFKDIVEILSPRSVVVHAGYDPYRFDGKEDEWFTPFSRMMEFVLDLFPARVLVENTFEWDPGTFLRVLDEFGKSLGICLDIAHLFLYSRDPVETWIDALWNHIEEFHLSDNRGIVDDHLPIGMGSLEFSKVERIVSHPSAFFTVEVFDEKLVWKGIESIFNFLEESFQLPG